MNRIRSAAVVLMAACAALAGARGGALSTPSDNDVELPNGWHITPAGRQIPTPGDQPLTMILTPDGRHLIVNTAGFHDHSVSVLDIASEKIVSSVELGKDWAGMALNPRTSDLYISGGGQVGERSGAMDSLDPAIRRMLHEPVLHLRYSGGSLSPTGPVHIDGLDEQNRYISGLALASSGALYALNINTDTVYKLDPARQTVLASTAVGYRPYAVRLSPDGRDLAVSNWGGSSVSILDAETLHERSRVDVGSHPNSLLYAADGRLFVANGGSNSVSVIRDCKVVETIKTSLAPDDLVGSTPDALAVSPDQKNLYVANADNNDVAVIDVSSAGDSRIRGFIPTGWYPSALAVSPDGRRLFVGVGKGLSFGRNYPTREPAPGRGSPNPDTPFDYIGNILSGAVSVVDVPDAKRLAQYTAEVRGNAPDPEQKVDRAYAAQIRSQVFPRIRHVLFIIRENRTYDQVFGDLRQGNGDPHLTFFGQGVTPNAHSLATRYVLFDNLYANGEVSQDGHQWCNAAYVTDFTEKAWITAYSRHGQPDADERLTASPAGYLWEDAARHGLTYRTYGEYGRFTSTPDGPPRFVGKKSLEGHASEGWALSKGRDPDKVDVFLRELKEADQRGEWPSYMVMALGEDHTDGLRAGSYTPASKVASNDQALGRIVDGVSHSRFWQETAIFVIEDDAQNGPDHVDAHRTVGLVISPYLKRNFVDHTMYTTVSMLRTMELILGLPPMTQYDKLATPMYNAFTTEPLFTAYSNIPNTQVDLEARNPSKGTLAERSARLDFSEPDRADPDELNSILWAAFRPGEPMPAPVRSSALLSGR